MGRKASTINLSEDERYILKLRCVQEQFKPRQ